MTLKKNTPDGPYPINKLLPCIFVIHASQQRPLRLILVLPRRNVDRAIDLVGQLERERNLLPLIRLLARGKR